MPTRERKGEDDDGTRRSREAVDRAPPDRDRFAGQRLLDVKTFCDRTGFSASTVRRLIRRGRLPVYQPGGRRCRVLIPAGALDGALECPAEEKPRERIPGPRPKWLRGPSPESDEHPENEYGK